jgi:hypothetical protein
MRKLSASTNVDTPGDPDRIGGELIADDGQTPAAGSRVELNKHVFGHVAGAQGVVVRGAVKGKGMVLVRFDLTGYRISVPREALNTVT